MNVAELLKAHGAAVLLDDPSQELCQAVKRGQAEYMEVSERQGCATDGLEDASSPIACANAHLRRHMHTHIHICTCAHPHAHAGVHMRTM